MEVYLWEEDEILVLEFDDCLPMGSGVLSVRFDGVLNDKMRGFYRRFAQFMLLDYDSDTAGSLFIIKY